ncbi:MAG TPA: malectin domain-containing carbohydrate-binding protein, partial [Chitinophagaceae bacterium]|nr:malectin domain-containing carbohydrate-binding protein [Chitinophagaceae bacterium]
FIILSVFLSLWFNIAFAQNTIRQDISLNNNWYTIANEGDKPFVDNFYAVPVDYKWKQVNIPHNWDAYEGYRRLLHGNRHGDSWYRKTFSIKQTKNKKRFFLYFEGAGSYATVYLNGKYAGEHAGGRTTFTIDVTDIIKTDGSNNELAVRAYHPANIKDLPWVCGGCSEERGFSEGSQPMGIFRPVHLIVTNDVRIEPFGIHAWADLKNTIDLNINTTIKNYSKQKRSIDIVHQLVDVKGKLITSISAKQTLNNNDPVVKLLSKTISQYPTVSISDIQLWSPDNPYLYKIISIVKENNIIIDKTETEFGFRTVNWKNPTNQFFINGKPVFINGIAEYEHLLGQSHAFSNEQIISRMKWLKMAGFNAFRDGHQPHNLLYGQLCNKMGVVWWTQLSAHVWYDSPTFRNNFKKLLREWVIERRNDPSVVLWGLQNESKLPEDFAKECTELIRQLDPTASSQRLVTTCNGGSGTDWDVPQNWTGTYGGNPDTYAGDVKKQVLIGEYGAWRTLDLHTEGGFVQNGVVSEDRMTQLMEQKVRLAESAKDSSAGQFFWLLTSHDNPGRVQGGEGLREVDRIGPVNYKGLLTPWEEPADVFYMFRSNYASKEKEPMVYIVSHTWPNRWAKPGIKDSICVYSNCDEVELFNDIDNWSLGRRKRNGVGTHFQWDDVLINYNVLYAIGYINGKAVAKDTIVLNHLPQSPYFNKLYSTASSILKPQPGYNYIYRINCGGPDYIDEHNNRWSADRAISNNNKKSNNTKLLTPDSRLPTQLWGSSSWTNDFPGMPSFFASQRRTVAPIKGTRDWKLFQDFRYGKDKLKFEFPLPPGEYLVEFYFTEPWLGIGGGMNCNGMRLFDIAINNKTVLQNVDVWQEAGTNKALKKIVKIKISGGKMTISFPQSKAGQAIISAIAIASLEQDITPHASQSLIRSVSSKQCKLSTWLDIGNKQYYDGETKFLSLPPYLYSADWLQFSENIAGSNSFTVTEDADIFIGIGKDLAAPEWLKGYENTQTEITTDKNGLKSYSVYRKRFLKKSTVSHPAGNDIVVAVLPVTHMQPAFDLKPVTSYRTNVAVVSEGVQKEMFATRECAVVKSESEVTMQWPIQTGVADIYSITLKYFYPFEKELKGELQLIDGENRMMLDIPVNFTFTRTGKWNQFTVNTGNMINAGNYTAKLIIKDAEGLAVLGIEIQ